MPTASCSRSRSRSSSRRSTRALLAQGQALHPAAGGALSRLRMKELTLVPRPVNRPVECWQPVVSASARGLDFMVRHGIKGAVGGGAATMAEGPIQAYREAAARAGKNLKLGENLTVGIFFYLPTAARRRSARSRRTTRSTSRCSRRWASCPASPRRRWRRPRARRLGCGGRADARPLHETRLLVRRHPEQLIEHLKKLEARYPGMEHINLSTSLGTPRPSCSSSSSASPRRSCRRSAERIRDGKMQSSSG